MKPETISGNMYPDAPRPAVGAIVFKDDAVLLVQRANPPAKGMWAIPGGSIRLGESLQAAAEREIMEETGVVIQAGDPVFVFDTIHRDGQGEIQYHYVIVDVTADYVNGEPRADDDAADARWITESELVKLNVNPATRRLLWEHYKFGEPVKQDDRDDR